jgi:hypothetical protein
MFSYADRAISNVRTSLFFSTKKKAQLVISQTHHLSTNAIEIMSYKHKHIIHRVRSLKKEKDDKHHVGTITIGQK